VLDTGAVLDIAGQEVHGACVARARRAAAAAPRRGPRVAATVGTGLGLAGGHGDVFEWGGVALVAVVPRR
jgi:hypothetical protein